MTRLADRLVISSRMMDRVVLIRKPIRLGSVKAIPSVISLGTKFKSCAVSFDIDFSSSQKNVPFTL